MKVWNRKVDDFNLGFYTDITCDACNTSNFPGTRYKCLVCYEYNLCSNCHNGGAESGQHTSDHPMQYIMTADDLGTKL